MKHVETQQKAAVCVTGVVGELPPLLPSTRLPILVRNGFPAPGGVSESPQAWEAGLGPASILPVAPASPL